jgi:signal transduction histidine kinase
MYKRDMSIFTILSLLFAFIIVFVMSIYMMYYYHVTKERLYTHAYKVATLTSEQLQGTLSDLINSYAINEYQKIISVHMNHAEILAIVVDDKNMAKIVGDDHYIVGMIKEKQDIKESYNTKNKNHISIIESSYKHIHSDIYDEGGKKVADLSIYLSDAPINKELNNFVYSSALEIVVLSIILIIALYISINLILLKPLYNISSSIMHQDDNGIPYDTVPVVGTKELQNLSHSMNSMISTIKTSNKELNELNENLESKVNQKLNEIRDKEQLLIQKSKLASMGEMIGNIAHQWRQPLSAIKAVIQSIELKQRLGKLDDEHIKKSVKESVELVNYMSATIDDFRNFFLPSKEKREFDIVQSIADVTKIVSSQLTHNNISLITNIETNDTKIVGYPNEFKQVVINIINNAKDAIVSNKKEGGKISITIDKVDDKNTIYIDDNGGGIDEEIIHKIFEPYFTTKFESNGTGLGLYMSKTIIEQNMQGRLNIENIDGGARFTIIL